MLANISWETYLTVIILLTAIWYGYVGAVYYRPEIQKFLAKRPALKTASAHEPENELSTTDEPEMIAASEEEEFEPELDDGFAEEIDTMITKIQEGIEESITRRYNKKDLTLLLAIILKDHLELKDSAFGAVIEELILSECEKQGVHFFNEKEIAALWDHEV